MLDPSPAYLLCKRLVDALGKENAHRAVDVMLTKLTTVELAALVLHWEFWARPKQFIRPGPWRTHGFLAGRGWGKTVAISCFINREVYEGRAHLIGLAAQDEQSSIDIQVNGPSGLIATAAPKNRPAWMSEARKLVWPNGAMALVRTPERPGKIRGPEYHLSWLAEIQSWPTVHRAEAISNFEFSTRLGDARIVWDATAKRGHPILKDWIKRAKENPELHRLVNGSMYENLANLAPAAVAEVERLYAGTRKGKEEIFGEMPADDEGAMFKQEWIDARRRERPTRFLCKCVSIDPAVTDKKGSDITGIVGFGLGVDGQGYVLRDISGKIDTGKWPDMMLDVYIEEDCDFLIAETNKGGRLVVQNIRAAAKERKLEVVVINNDEKPHKTKGVIYVKEVHARGTKADRAEPVATQYEKGRISHVRGVNLSSLEETLTTWEPAPNADSPGDLDALVHAAVDLLGLNDDTPDNSKTVDGIDEINKELTKRLATTSPVVRSNLAAILGGTGTGGRI